METRKGKERAISRAGYLASRSSIPDSDTNQVMTLSVLLIEYPKTSREQTRNSGIGGVGSSYSPVHLHRSRKMVDFPPPEDPTMAIFSPGRTSSDNPSRTGTPVRRK